MVYYSQWCNAYDGMKSSYSTLKGENGNWVLLLNNTTIDRRVLITIFITEWLQNVPTPCPFIAIS